MSALDTTASTKTAPTTSGRQRKTFARRASKPLFYLLLAVISVILFTPFILAFLGTFKSDAEIIAWPPSFFPEVWLFENWPKLFNTDFGGLPRPEGATSLGLMAGMLVFFAGFLVLGTSSETKGRGMSPKVGLLLAIALAIGTGVAAGLLSPEQ